MTSSSMRHAACRFFMLAVALIIAVFPGRAAAQSGAGTLPNAPTPQAVTLRATLRRILQDQEAIWSSPARIRESNALEPIALVLGAALVMTTDHEVESSAKLQNPSLNNDASKASDGLVGGLVAAPAAIFVVGAAHHDNQATETGILAGEAVFDSLVVSEAAKAVSMRERPTADDAKGKFFQSGVGLNSSFPSNHAIVAWSSAAVVASEYDGPFTQILAYGMASGVSITRVLARQHFPSDAFVGSAVGWMIGRYVVRRHHFIG